MPLVEGGWRQGRRAIELQKMRAAWGAIVTYSCSHSATSRLSLILLCACGVNALAAEAPAGGKPRVFPADIRVERGVAFLPADRAERADIYSPLTIARGERLPAVLIIHGGGWTGGARDAEREINIGSTLARNGYLGMSIDYLLSRNKAVAWPTNLWDCKTAVRWLRVNAARLQVNPDRIGVIGGSAGGHLALMVAMTAPADGLDPASPWPDISCRVNCCVDLYGVADLPAYHDVAMLGKKQFEAPELYRRASPVTYATPDDPPVLVLHGTADRTVDLKQSEALAEVLKKARIDHELVVIPGAPHTFHLQPAQRDLRPTVLGFFDKHLKKP